MGDYGAGVVEGVDEAGIPPGLIVGGTEPAGARVKPRALEGEGGTGSRLCGADGAGRRRRWRRWRWRRWRRRRRCTPRAKTSGWTRSCTWHVCRGKSCILRWRAMRRTWSTSISATQLRSTAGANTGIITGPSAVGGAALGGGVAAAATEAVAALEGEGASAEAEAATPMTTKDPWLCYLRNV